MGGDCLNSGSDNCGADINNSIINKQSPVKGAATKAYRAYTSELQVAARRKSVPVHRGSQVPKVITIFNSNDLRFDVASDLSFLIRYSPLNGRTKRYIYKRITDSNRIQSIERQGYRWLVQDVDQCIEYIVLRQCRYEYGHYHYTGVEKIVLKTRATIKNWATVRVEANLRDWIYFEKG